jgi:hypothetical protein
MTRGQLNSVGRRKFLLGLAGLGLMSFKFPASRAFQPFTPFTFAHVCGCNLCNDQPDSYELTQESQLFLQQLVKQLNQDRVDFVMFGGDQVRAIGKNEDNWALFQDCLAPLTCPWSFVLGERDVSGPTPIDKNKMYFPDWKLIGIKTDTGYWSHNPKGAPDIHIIGLDSSLPNTTIGGISGRQLAWLKNDLEENKKFFTMVFCHHPLLPPAPYDGGPPWDDHVIPDASSVREVLASYPQVKMVLTGHVPVNKVQVEKGIYHISTPPLVVYPCAYRIFRVEPDGVTMETRPIDYPALVKKARRELASSSLAGRFSQKNPNSFVELVSGDKLDYDAFLPMHGAPQLQALGSKKPMRRAEVREAKEEPETKAPQPTSKEQPVAAEGKRRGFFHKQKSTEEMLGKNQSANQPSVDTMPESKPVELPDVKNVDEELNKQLNLPPSPAKDGK